METDALKLLAFLLDFSLLLACQLLLILLLRKPLRMRAGAVAAYRLWLLPLLWLPFYLADLGFLLELLPSAARSAGGLITSVPKLSEGVGVNPQRLSPLPEEGPASALVVASLLAVWLAGILLLGLRQTLQARRFTSYLASSARSCSRDCRRRIVHEHGLPDSLEVLLVEGLPSPALYGIRRPRLLLPAGFFTSWEPEARFVMLSHEAVHHRRRDNFWNVLAALVQTLFWFHPLLYPAYRRYRQDQELSCDALALDQCSPSQRRRYARTLIETSSPALRRPALPTLSGWHHIHELKERAMMISRHSLQGVSPSFGKSVLGMLAVLGTLVSGVYGAGSTGFTVSFEAVVISDEHRSYLHDEILEWLDQREESWDPVPADSDYVVFVMDTSDSMYLYAWEPALQELAQVWNAYAGAEGFQVMSDEGVYLLPESRGAWLANSPAQLDEVLRRLRDFNVRSNSSPLEAIAQSLDELVDSGPTTSIFVFSDEWTAMDNSPEVITDLVEQAAPGARVHTRMFTPVLTGEAQYRETAHRLAAVMLQVAERTGGSFEIVGGVTSQEDLAGADGADMSISFSAREAIRNEDGSIGLHGDVRVNVTSGGSRLSMEADALLIR